MSDVPPTTPQAESVFTKYLNFCKFRNPAASSGTGGSPAGEGTRVAKFKKKVRNSVMLVRGSVRKRMDQTWQQMDAASKRRCCGLLPQPPPPPSSPTTPSSNWVPSGDSQGSPPPS